MALYGGIHLELCSWVGLFFPMALAWREITLPREIIQDINCKIIQWPFSSNRYSFNIQVRYNNSTGMCQWVLRRDQSIVEVCHEIILLKMYWMYNTVVFVWNSVINNCFIFRFNKWGFTIYKYKYIKTWQAIKHQHSMCYDVIRVVTYWANKNLRRPI